MLWTFKLFPFLGKFTVITSECRLSVTHRFTKKMNYVNSWCLELKNKIRKFGSDTHIIIWVPSILAFFPKMWECLLNLCEPTNAATHMHHFLSVCQGYLHGLQYLYHNHFWVRPTKKDFRLLISFSPNIVLHFCQCVDTLGNVLRSQDTLLVTSYFIMKNQTFNHVLHTYTEKIKVFE